MCLTAMSPLVAPNSAMPLPMSTGRRVMTRR
jgi:hypothetical protein